MKLNSFEELFVFLLSDIYEVENQIIKGIPLLMKKVYSDDLKEALTTHLAETKEQVVRLNEIFKIINKTPKSIEWSSDVQRLFSDMESFVQENTPSPLLDAAIIAMTQRIEHFEIATYGTLREFADVLDYDDVHDILKDTLKEESHADTLLTKIAEGGLLTQGVNVKAKR